MIKKEYKNICDPGPQNQSYQSKPGVYFSQKYIVWVKIILFFI